MFEIVGKYAKAIVMIDEVDPETRSQIYSFLNDPSFVSPIVVMPDCHKGEGAVIGFTMPLPLNGRIIPSIVGVDQSCGMLCARLLDDLSHLRGDDWAQTDVLIRCDLPMGKAIHETALINMEYFNWKRLNRLAVTFTNSYNERFGTNYGAPVYSLDWFRTFCRRIGIDESYAIRSIGTLGGGNHFVVFGVD
jgi:hypothetical protein